MSESSELLADLEKIRTAIHDELVKISERDFHGTVVPSLDADTITAAVVGVLAGVGVKRPSLLGSSAAEAGLCPRCLHTAHEDIGECMACYCKSLKP